MAKKEKHLYRCTYVINGDNDSESYSDFYVVNAYSPCHAWQKVCKHLVEVEGVPLSVIHQDTIRVDFIIPNFLK